MKRLLITLALAAALLALLVAPSLAAARTHLQPSVIASWAPSPPDGQFAESMAIDSHGTTYVSNTVWGPWSDELQDYSSNVGEVWRVEPNGDKTRVASMDISAYGMFLGVAIDRNDRAYVLVDDFSADYGLPPTIGDGVYRLEGDALTKVVDLPLANWPNGLAFHKGYLYISDCWLGCVWRARVGDEVPAPAAPWIEDPLLGPSASWMGINGIAFKGDALYGIVSAYGRVVRVPVKSDGTAGRVSVVCKWPQLKTGDGIAFDVLGRLWVVTNGSKVTPDGGLWRVARDGSLTKVANDPGWLNYPTQPAFGRTCSTATTLYVLNGAYYDFLDGSAPDLISLPVGVAGLPLR